MFSQFWLNPLVDDCQINYSTKLTPKKKKKRKKKATRVWIYKFFGELINLLRNKFGE
jgi:hypothetical protein